MYGRMASHTNLGYDWHQFEGGFEGLDVSESGKLLWPQLDTVMVEASVNDYINSDTPFHVYYLTISGHMPYSDNRVVAPYRETVRALPYSETTQNYIATVMEVDKALKTLLDRLEAAGKLEKPSSWPPGTTSPTSTWTCWRSCPVRSSEAPPTWSI